MYKNARDIFVYPMDSIDRLKYVANTTTPYVSPNGNSAFEKRTAYADHNFLFM